MHTKFWPRNLIGRGHVGDLDVDWRIRLRWILEKQNVNLKTQTDVGQGSLASYCEICNIRGTDSILKNILRSEVGRDDDRIDFLLTF
jgi:hypothetical protein